jgi:hypothetical protein
MSTTTLAKEMLTRLGSPRNRFDCRWGLRGGGDGVDESFTAQMIVSADDIAPDIAGTQNLWIQGVGCASAIANFSS